MKRADVGKIKLTDDEKNRMYSEIETFYLDVREQEIGMIEREQILDMFMDELAPIIYDKALEDTKRWFVRQLDNLESDYYMLNKNK